jgi:hypothetical protein
MKTYQANQSCPYGFYFSPSTFQGHFVGADGESFEGRPGVRFYRFPNTLLVLMSPVIGGLFVLAFPLLILVSVALIGSYSVGKLVWNFLMPRANLLESRWEPSMAYLTRPKKGEKNEKDDYRPVSRREFDKQVSRELENDR